MPHLAAVLDDCEIRSFNLDIENYVKYNHFCDDDGIDNVTLRL